ncbi:F390 synthetase-related protein [Eupransor demetentiae]|uniref:Adenylate-forming domain family (PaaK) n=1 Tax=Eupransor demetentiae TaxID=3109584 RepID=A0ABP0EQB6_9LACO|nr:Phenylacetate-coenzyme A ligase PaaK [Lactobacillaceae bacterium LMG 33000]
MVQLGRVATTYFKTRWDAKHIKSRAQLEGIQKRRLKRLLNWLPADNYYAPYKKTAWQEIPIADKASWLGHFNEINTLGLDFDQTREFAREQERTRDFDDELRPGISVGLSSGTSGNQGVFLTSQREQSLWLGAILAKLLPKLPKKQKKVAFFMRANNNLYESSNSSLLAFRFFDLFADVEENLAKLEDFQADILIAPPAMLLEIVAFYQKKGLVLPFSKIISIAETLEPEDKAYLEEVTGQTIHQVYQATEGFLGATCEYGTLHLNEDNLLFEQEVVDEEDGLFVPIITDFYRHSQPVIRYRLNDVLQKRATPCPCGSPMLALERIIGREDDVLTFEKANQAGIRKLFPDFVRKIVLEADNRIQNYQVVQEKDGTLTISLENEGLYPAVEANFKQFFNREGLVAPAMHYQTYRYDFKDGKRRKIIHRK